MAKYRLGFVSNSSSSSFVVKGYLLPKDNFDYHKMTEIMDKFEFDYGDNLEEDNIKDIFYNYFLDELRDKELFMSYYTEDGSPDDDTIIIGKLLAETDSEDMYFNTMVLDLEDTPELKQIKEKMNIDTPIKIIVGTRYC